MVFGSSFVGVRVMLELGNYSTEVSGVKSFGGGFLGEGVWTSHDQEFEGLDTGELSGGMDSCLRRNDDIGGWGGGERCVCDGG